MTSVPALAADQAEAALPRPAATPDRTLHMIGNAHLDPVWLWPWQEGYQEARATFWSAITRMDEYPDFVFTCDQVVLLSWVEESDPELFARIRQRVADGRWVNAGGWWVEPDCNMPMGESFVRQGLYGQRYLQDRFGSHATVGMNVDPFGHNAMLPQILRGQGMDSYMFLRPGPHESDFRDTLFQWEAPDGSRVLAYRIPFEYGSPGGAVDGQADKALGQLDPRLSDAMVFYGVGNHGGGPTRANIESIHRYDRMGSFGRMHMASPRDYFDLMRGRGEAYLDALPVRRDDLQHHAPGCYSAHSGIKAWQRRAQHALLTAERWAAVVALHDEVPYPREELERAWKQVLFNQFHDVLPGSAIEPAYEDARDQLGEAVAVAKRITVRAHNVLARQIDVPFEDATQPVVVFNQHPWAVATDVELNFGGQRGGVHVVDDGGAPVVFQRTQGASTTDDASRGALVFRAELPALGYRLYRLRPGPAPAAVVPAPTPLVVTESVLENANLRVELDPHTGWIVALLDKRTGADLMRGSESERHTRVRRDPTDTWGHRVVSYAGTGMPMRVQRIVVRETGPLRGRVRIERAFGGSTLVEELVLDHDGDALRVLVTLDWREHAHLLKLRFPTALTDPHATFEIPFGSIQRPVDGAEEPAQSWVDLSGTAQGIPAGLTLITTNKHGYDVSPGDHPSIGVTAVRSPVYAWHDPKVLDPEGLYSFQDQGVQRFAYELVPHGGDHRAIDPVRRATLLGSPVRAMLESFHGGLLPASSSFASDGAGGVVITALKGSEDPAAGRGGADLIVRAVETRGERTTARLELPLAGRVLEHDFGPYQLRTFRVPADPAKPVVEVDLVEWPIETVPGNAVDTVGRPPQGTAAPAPEPAAEDAASSASARRGEVPDGER